MRRVAFLCRLCGTDTTDFLLEAPEGILSPERGVALVPPGRFVRVSRQWSYRELLASRSPSPEWDVVVFEEGDYLLNIDDVRHGMLPGAVHGCCGYQPRGEANARCSNRHVIGSVHSDECFSALVFRLLGGAVEPLPLHDDPARPL